MATKFIPYSQSTTWRDESERLIHEHCASAGVVESMVNFHRLHNCLMSELNAVGKTASKAARTRFRVNLNSVKHNVLVLRKLIKPIN